jgi:hypothetical protein
MVRRATRALSALILRIAAYGALFAVVVAVHLALSGVLRSLGLDNGVSLLISGIVVLTLVLSAISFAERGQKRREAGRDAARTDTPLRAPYPNRH